MIVVSNISALANLAAEGRHAAKRLGLRVVGVVGILPETKAKGAIDNIRPHMDALRQAAGFYLSNSPHRYALALTGESDE
jgi:predicted nucleic acid-binding protein